MSKTTYKPVSDKRREELKQVALNTLKKVGRPAKPIDEKAVSIHLKINPKTLSSLKKKAEKTGIPYQTLINQILNKAAWLINFYHFEIL